MKAKEFDKRFENGEEILSQLDMDSARHPNQNSKRVNVDFPVWMVNQLDSEALRLGVTRQSIIKFWISERIERLSSNS